MLGAATYHRLNSLSCRMHIYIYTRGKTGTDYILYIYPRFCSFLILPRVKDTICDIAFIALLSLVYYCEIEIYIITQPSLI